MCKYVNSLSSKHPGYHIPGEASWLGEDVAFDHQSSLVSLTSFLQSSSVYAPLYTRRSTVSSPWSWHPQWHHYRKKDLCRVLSILPSVFFQALGKEGLCLVSFSALGKDCQTRGHRAGHVTKFKRLSPSYLLFISFISYLSRLNRR
jgi:hypothetical protein